MEAKEINNGEISLKDFIFRLVEWWKYFRSKIVIILLFGILGGGMGLVYAWISPSSYKAVVSFALEDDKPSGGLSGALGLASSLGIDLGNSAGGAFSGANLIELMKSRRIVGQTLLEIYEVDGKKKILANELLSFSKLGSRLAAKSNQYIDFAFGDMEDPSNLSIRQDTVMKLLYDYLFQNNILTIAQRDKKISIITVEVNSNNELFSKVFSEQLVKNVSDFYVETKSKKARSNVAILQKQTDSIRNELNQAISGVAVSSDNTYNLNPALNVNRVPSTRKQVDVQANTAILTQLVTNLEMAKVTLMRETPLIQLIDRPTLPLKKDKPGKFKSLILGGLLAGFLSLVLLIIQRVGKQIMQ